MLSYYKNIIVKFPNVYLVKDYIDLFPQGFTEPDSIREWSRRKLPNHHNVLKKSGMIIDGDWDTRGEFKEAESYDRSYYLDLVYNDIKFEESLFYKSMENHFVAGIPWEETNYIQEIYGILEKRGTVTWGGVRSTRKEILSRAAQIDQLYESMANEGYKTQRELGSTKREQIENEVIVDIDRAGELLLVDGKHRLALAKILDIDSIKITVMAVQEKWVDKTGLKQCLTSNTNILSL